MSAAMLRSFLVPLALLVTTPATAQSDPPAAPAEAADATTTPAPKRVAAAPAKPGRDWPFSGPLVGGITALVIGVPLTAVCTAGLMVTTLAMTVVLFQVQDWKTGDFKLDEDTTTTEFKPAVQARAWRWSHYAMPFLIIGLAGGIVSTAIGATLLVSGLVLKGE